LGIRSTIAKILEKDLFQYIDIASTAATDLIRLQLLAIADLLPGKIESQTAELRDDIIASQWIVQVTAQYPGTSGISEEELKSLAAL
jgi:hypothetical protein